MSKTWQALRSSRRARRLFAEAALFLFLELDGGVGDGVLRETDLLANCPATPRQWYARKERNRGVRRSKMLKVEVNFMFASMREFHFLSVMFIGRRKGVEVGGGLCAHSLCPPHCMLLPLL